MTLPYLKTVTAHVGRHEFTVRYPPGQEDAAWQAVRKWRHSSAMRAAGFSAELCGVMRQLIFDPPSPYPPECLT